MNVFTPRTGPHARQAILVTSGVPVSPAVSAFPAVPESRFVCLGPPQAFFVHLPLLS